MLDYEYLARTGANDGPQISRPNRHAIHSDGPCAHVGALFSGLPRALRNEGILTVLQAWFDESGKAKVDSPIFLLAGYVGKKEMWEDFADDWQHELERPPALPYLHIRESQLFKGMSFDDRTERTLRFVEIIRKHKPLGITFMVRHVDYDGFYGVVRTHPDFKPPDRKVFKNPYYTSFLIVLNLMLIGQAKRFSDTGKRELIEVLFDENLDKPARLKAGFARFVDTARRHNPEFLNLFIRCAVTPHNQSDPAAPLAP